MCLATCADPADADADHQWPGTAPLRQALDAALVEQEGVGKAGADAGT